MNARGWLVIVALLVGAPAARAADDPAQVGAWNADPPLASAPFPLAPVPAAPTDADRTYAVHAAVLLTGKVLFYGMLPPGQGNGSEAYLWDPAKGYGAPSFTHVPLPRVDVDGDGVLDRTPVYCSGQSFLPDGRLLITGGTLYKGSLPGFKEPGGIRTAFTFDPYTETWTRQPDMDAGRYYPTQTELADGRTLVLAGYSDAAPGGLDNPALEVYAPVQDSFQLDRAHLVTGDRPDLKGVRRAPTLYPRMFLMPDRRVLLAGPGGTDGAILDPDRLAAEGEVASAWTELAHPPSTRHGGMAVLQPDGPDGSSRVLTLGGWTETNPATGLPYPAGARPPLATSTIVDGGAADPVWAPGPPLAAGRSFANSVLLPDGTIATVGGGAGQVEPDGQFAVDADGASEGKPGAPLRRVELLDPATGEVTLGPAQQEDRAYHSTAVLLPDGRIFSGGDNLHPKEPDGSPSRSDTAELYSPPYLFRGPRPEIDAAPGAVGYGDEIGIASRSPDVERAVLIAPAATTHSFDMGQRFVPLRVVRTAPGDGLDVVTPPSPAVAPPGYYMLWLLDGDGVPSLARWVRVGPDAPDQPSLPTAPEPSPDPSPSPAAEPTVAPTVAPSPAPPAGEVLGETAAQRRLSVSVRSPRDVRAGRLLRFVVTVSAGGRPVRGARVQLAGGLTVRTGQRGRARLRVRFARPGLVTLTVAKGGYAARRLSIGVSRRRRPA